MKATFYIQNKTYTIDVSKPIDISLVLSATEKNPLAWYLDKPSISPVRLDNWVGSVEQGASVNFNNIQFNPHAHGTHTECVGHITKGFHSIHTALKTFFFTAQVVTLDLEQKGDDFIITKNQIENQLGTNKPQAIVIRTFPNGKDKQQKKYSNTNWPYLEADAAAFLNEQGIQHLLIDLPSVDKEKDDGALAAHKAFWGVPNAVRYDATITEFVYVPSSIKDGLYILNLQVANIENDAAPSRPILYKTL